MPKITNAILAELADAAIETFKARSGSDPDDSLKDLLCDLMHWADRHSDLCGSFESVLADAEQYYLEEVGMEDEDAVV